MASLKLLKRTCRHAFFAVAGGAHSPQDTQEIMGGGAATGTELLSDETSQEVAKLSETARKELEAKKMLADVVADQKNNL